MPAFQTAVGHRLADIATKPLLRCRAHGVFAELRSSYSGNRVGVVCTRPLPEDLQRVKPAARPQSSE